MGSGSHERLCESVDLLESKCVKPATDRMSMVGKEVVALGSWSKVCPQGICVPVCTCTGCVCDYHLLVSGRRCWEETGSPQTVVHNKADLCVRLLLYDQWFSTSHTYLHVVHMYI